MVQIQIDLTNETNKLLKSACKILGVTKRSFCKTAIYTSAKQTNQKIENKIDEVEILGDNSKKRESSIYHKPNNDITQNHNTINKKNNGVNK